MMGKKKQQQNLEYLEGKTKLSLRKQKSGQLQPSLLGKRIRKHCPLLKGNFWEKVKSRLTYRHPNEHMFKILF